jgi:hypothetical protein
MYDAVASVLALAVLVGLIALRFSVGSLHRFGAGARGSSFQ